MKKLFAVLILLFGLNLSSSAQEIFNMILNDAKKVINNPKSDRSLAKIAQFKYTDLQYIKKKAFERPGDVTEKFLNDQAYYMSQFISSFIQEVLLNTSLTKKEKKDQIMLYIDASCSNPLFNDTEKDVVNAYIDNSSTQLTPFCLDTDWTKAYAAVMSKMKAK